MSDGTVGSAHVWDVFVSFASEDLRVAQRIQKQLESIPHKVLGRTTRLRVFVYTNDLGAGADLPVALKSEIWQSNCLLVVCSRKSLYSDWVKKEIAYSQEGDRPSRVLACYFEDEWESVRNTLPANMNPAAISLREQYATQRIAAGALDIPVDQLIGRARRHRRKVLSLSASIACPALLSVLFGGTTLHPRILMFENEELSSVVQVSFKDKYLLAAYEPAVNQHLKTDTVFRIAPPLGRPTRPQGAGFPKNIYGQNIYLPSTGHEAAMVQIGTSEAKVTPLTAHTTRQLTRHLPSPYPSPSKHYHNAAYPILLDSFGLPEAYVDATGKLIWWKDDAWHVYNRDLAMFDRINCLGKGSLKTGLWVSASRGIFLLEETGSRHVLDVTVNSADPSVDISAEDKAAIIRNEERIDIFDLRDPAHIPGTLQNPMELFGVRFDGIKKQNLFYVVRFSEDGQNVIGGTSNGRVNVWDLSGRLLLHTETSFGGITTVSMSNDRKYLGIGNLSGTLWFVSRPIVFLGIHLRDISLWNSFDAKPVDIVEAAR